MNAVDEVGETRKVVERSDALSLSKCRDDLAHDKGGGRSLKSYMYILKCADESFYTGSTKDLERRLAQHQNGEGANYTRKRLPVKLVYTEEYERIDAAFYREKQVQGWSRAKKEALMSKQAETLKERSECGNNSHSDSKELGTDW